MITAFLFQTCDAIEAAVKWNSESTSDTLTLVLLACHMRQSLPQLTECARPPLSTTGTVFLVSG